MGFFSWKTSDTNRTIYNVHASKPTFEVHMITRDGYQFTEDSYSGYGEFDGMCYYKLVDLINGGEGDRGRGLELAFGTTIITNGEQTFTFRKDFNNWATDKLIGDKNANDLVSEGWKVEKIRHDIQLPKFVEVLPNKDSWEEEFDKLPDSEICISQGYTWDI